MANPTIYEPGYDFAATDKGAELNVELQRIQVSVQSIATALADIRRSDGKLKNAVVTPEALNATALSGISDLAAGLEAELTAAVARAGAASAAATTAVVTAQMAEAGAVTAAEQATAAAVSATTALADSRFAFSASKSADQTGILSATATKITFPTEIFDFGGYYDAANSRFVPPSGRYRLAAGLAWSAGLVDARQVTVEIWKNGVVYRVFGVQVSGTTDSALVSGSCLVEANGTDYFEVYGTGQGTGNKTVALTTTMTFFEGEAI